MSNGELAELERRVMRAVLEANRAQDKRTQELVAALGELKDTLDGVIKLYNTLNTLLKVLGAVQRVATWAASIGALWYLFWPSSKK